MEPQYKQHDLSGTFIKVQLGDDIKRIPIHNKVLTYDELVLTIKTVFNEKLSSKDDIKIKDEALDFMISNNRDLSLAVQQSRVLRFKILRSGENGDSDVLVRMESSILELTLKFQDMEHKIDGITKDFQEIRNKVDRILENLEVKGLPSSSVAERTNNKNIYNRKYS